MKYTILTLFKDFMSEYFNHSIMKRSLANKAFELEIVDIRDFSKDKHHHVDDKPYGGGAGMLLSVEPLYDALKSVKQSNSYVLLTSPKARPFDQKKAMELSKKEHLIFICGHYEGMDERIENYVDEHISIGDYILTGGELPTLVIIDTITRLLENTIKRESLSEESFTNGLLEYPQYTKPPIFHDLKVPEVLLSGNHEKIRKWRLKMSLLETLKYRKDLLLKHDFSKEEISLLKELLKDLKSDRL